MPDFLLLDPFHLLSKKPPARGEHTETTRWGERWVLGALCAARPALPHALTVPRMDAAGLTYPPSYHWALGVFTPCTAHNAPGTSVHVHFAYTNQHYFKRRQNLMFLFFYIYESHSDLELVFL